MKEDILLGGRIVAGWRDESPALADGVPLDLSLNFLVRHSLACFDLSSSLESEYFVKTLRFPLVLAGCLLSRPKIALLRAIKIRGSGRVLVTSHQ